ncbi:MAG TPA: hypothetical protein VGM72_05590 [Micropepsaceae bacterium]
MTDYRIYTLDSAEHIVRGVELQLSDDEEAVAAARQLVAGSPLEVWSGARRVARIDPADLPSAHVR